MSSISQGSSLRDTPSSNATATGVASSSIGNDTATKQAISGAQYQPNPFLGGSKDQLLNIIVQLLDLIGKWSGGTKPQPQPKPLTLSKQQDKNLREHFGFDSSISYQVVDTNRDGKLSAGDTLYFSSPVIKAAPITLTQADVDAINGKRPNSALQQFNANQKLWNSQGIDDYSFTLQRNCFCRGDALRPINIQVRDGKIAAATFADTGEPVPPELNFNKLTINDLFKEVGQAIKGGAERVEVSYDKTYGFPTSIYIDQSSQIADEEVGYTISNFRPEPVFTTLACGEEGNDCGLPPLDPPIQPPIGSTKALGEEDNGGKPTPIKPPIEPPIITTLALGEEDGGLPKQ